MAYLMKGLRLWEIRPINHLSWVFLMNLNRCYQLFIVVTKSPIIYLEPILIS